MNDGKRLAQTPVREPSAWEASRAHKIAQAAQVDKRVVQVTHLGCAFWVFSDISFALSCVSRVKP